MCGERGYVHLWDASNGALVTRYSVPSTAEIKSVAYTPDSSSIVVSGGSEGAWLMDVGYGKITSTYTGVAQRPPDCCVITMALSPSGKTVATEDMGTVRLVDTETETGKATATLAYPDDRSASSLAFNSDGTTVAAGVTDGKTYLWNTATGKLENTLTEVTPTFGTSPPARSPRP